MTVVLSMQNKRVPLTTALRMQGQLWRCSECGEFVHLRKIRNKPHVTHLTPQCEVPLSVQAIRPKAELLADSIAKIGSVKVSALRGAQEAGEFTSVPIERVVPFMAPGLLIPAVLVQSYWTVFVIGLVLTDAYDADFLALHTMADELGCGVLAAEVGGSNFAKELSVLFAPEDLNFAVWVAPVDVARVPRKWLLFKELIAQNVYETAAVRELKVGHFNAHEPFEKRHYAQDVLQEMHTKKWRAWAKKAVWNQDWMPEWFDWFDMAGKQAPNFWVLFWFIKHCFLAKSVQVHMDALAEKFVVEFARENADTAGVKFVTELFMQWAGQYVKEGKLLRVYEFSPTFVPLVTATGYVETQKI